MRSKRARWTVAAAIVGGSLLMATPAFADPPGNNGTIKIDGTPFDTAPDNQPHVGCTFQVDFYGFDAGPQNTAEVEFAVHPPTGDQVILTDEVPIGEDSHAGGGSEAGLDAERTYDLSSSLQDFTPGKQGYHVKLTIHADGSQGADVKHKVFWVRDCTPPPPDNGGTAEQPVPPSSATDEQPPADTGGTVEQPPVVAPSEQQQLSVAQPPVVAPAPEQMPTEVLGESIQRPPVVAQAVRTATPARVAAGVTSTAAPAALARTGLGHLLVEGVVALALLLGGALTLRARRRLAPG